MNIEEYKIQLGEELDTFDLEEFSYLVRSMIGRFTVIETAEAVADVLREKYARIKAEYMAQAMAIAILQNSELGTCKNLNNPFLRLAIFKGSSDIYNRYVEEVLDPMFEMVQEHEKEKFFTQLLSEAQKLTAGIGANYIECVQGTDFDLPLGMLDETSNVLLINYKDYQAMNQLVENFNSIVGRRDILNDLAMRAGLT